MSTGLLAEYDIDLSNVDAPEYGKPADDIYEFTLGDVYVQEGSKKNPNAKWVIFKYILGDSGMPYQEWFALPQDPHNPTDSEVTKLGFYKQRLAALGVAPDEMNTITSDDLIGTTGTFELRTTKGKDGNEYQNIRSFKVNSAETSAPAKKKPATAVDNPFA